MAEETTPTPAPAENASATPTPAGPPEGIDNATWKLGQNTSVLCSACHGNNGQGMPQNGPPFQNSEWVTGPVENLVRIQLRGLKGPITVNGVDYNPPAPMAPLAYQSDEQIAAVLTYVRNSFGNKASIVTPDMVAKHREEVGQPMLTVADLIPPKAEKASTLKAAPTKATPAKAVTTDLPKVENYRTFPNLLIALIFLLIVAGAFVKLLIGSKKS